MTGGDPSRHRPDGWGPGSCSPSRTDPKLWFIDVAGTAEAVVERLHEAFVAMLPDLRDTDRPGGFLPLIAMPVLGVRGGGKGAQRGDMVRRILDMAEDFVRAHPVDVVLTTIDPADYAAAQSIRSAKPQAVQPNPTMQRLIDHAKGGNLALFIGSGASVSAGLPTWNALLEEIAGEHLAELSGLSDPLDQGELLRRRLGRHLGDRVAETMQRPPGHALAHALLAGLECREAVTTNFDLCYESAVRSAGRRLDVVPWETASPTQSWLLKMHGTVQEPSSIVLSRRDFVQFQFKSGPSGAVLQALLLTRHLLVVGASFQDSNLLRLVHEVAAFREQVGVRSTPAHMGTVLTLFKEPAREALLTNDFYYENMLTEPDRGDHEATNRAGRELEIFLDRLAMLAADRSPYLLDRRYRHLLSDSEMELADRLSRLHEDVKQAALKSESWSGIRRQLAAAGLVDTPP